MIKKSLLFSLAVLIISNFTFAGGWLRVPSRSGDSYAVCPSSLITNDGVFHLSVTTGRIDPPHWRDSSEVLWEYSVSQFGYPAQATILISTSAPPGVYEVCHGDIALVYLGIGGSTGTDPVWEISVVFTMNWKETLVSQSKAYTGIALGTYFPMLAATYLPPSVSGKLVAEPLIVWKGTDQWLFRFESGAGTVRYNLNVAIPAPDLSSYEVVVSPIADAKLMTAAYSRNDPDELLGIWEVSGGGSDCWVISRSYDNGITWEETGMLAGPCSGSWGRQPSFVRNTECAWTGGLLYESWGADGNVTDDKVRYGIRYWGDMTGVPESLLIEDEAN